MVQMPTGTGKTALLAEVIRQQEMKNALGPQGRFYERSESEEGAKNEKCAGGAIGHHVESGVLIVAHRQELLEQIRETLETSALQRSAHRDAPCLEARGADTTFGEETNSAYTLTECPIFVESIQKLSRHINEVEMEPSLVVIDEAHHALAKTYKMLWERWPRAKFLGLTATPCRLNGAPFTDLFDVLLQSEDIQWFIKKGWLSDFEYVSVRPDSEEMRKVKGLRKRGADGDYQTKEMATVLDVPESIEHLYNTYHTYARGKKGIVYAIDRAHAQHIAAYYAAHGVRCAVIDAKTSVEERKKLVESYKQAPLYCPSGDKSPDPSTSNTPEAPSGAVGGASVSSLDVLINVDIFSEGFDCPEVEFIQLARPTLSLSKYLQQVGRGMRVTPGRPYVTILDQVGLYQTFGLPTDNRDWQKMFLGKVAGKGDASCGERPLIIRDEVADKELVNMDMLHIKRFDEKRTCIEVFLQHGRFGIMRLGHVTCAPLFRRVQRLRHPKFYALAQYDGTESSVTTVIDSEGQNMRLKLQGEVSVEGDIFVQRDANGRCLYYDAFSGQAYDDYPHFIKMAGLEVEMMHNEFYLRQRKNGLILFLSKGGTHYNEHIVISGDVLINKEEGGRQSRVLGYMGDSVLVMADQGIGYQQVSANGKRGECFALKPKDVTVAPDWERLGMRPLSAELRDERQQEQKESLIEEYHMFIKAMTQRDQVWQDNHLDGSFQVNHCGHVASRSEFIVAAYVRFHKIETLAVDLDINGRKALFSGQIRVKYQLLPSRSIAEAIYDFRLRMGKKDGAPWRFTRMWMREEAPCDPPEGDVE